MSKTKEKIEYICYSSLKSRGWTDKLISNLLPPPKLVKNPHYKSAPEMKLWDKNVVEEAEKKPEFSERKKKKEVNTQKRYEREQKKINEMASNIKVENPADNYQSARKIKRHFIIYVGGTNTGKTYNSLQALKKARTGVYLAPLRLLAMEVQDKFLSEDILCDMITGEEENLIPGAKIISSTVEMLDTEKSYEVAVIDECQMIADRDRGGSWTRAILGVTAETVYLCMSENALEICKKLISLCDGDTYEIHHCERKVPLRVASNGIDLNKLERGDAVIVFSRRKVLEMAQYLREKGKKVSVIYGALPYESRRKQVQDYIEGNTDIVVSTDAIGMGLNLPIKRVVYAETSKFDGITARELHPDEVLQISGRAGRYGMFDEGTTGIARNNLYETRNKTITRAFSRPLPSIDVVRVSFPEFLAYSSKKLSDTIKTWCQVKYPDIFIHQDVEVLLKRAKYLERKYKKEISPNTVFILSSVMFDENNEQLNETWERYCDLYMRGLKEKVYMPANNVKKDYTLESLTEYETLCKKYDLFYSFCKTIGKEIDMEKLRKSKRIITENINEIIRTQNAEKLKKRCKYCGKKLPLNYKYSMCQDCYEDYSYRRWYY